MCGSAGATSIASMARAPTMIERPMRGLSMVQGQQEKSSADLVSRSPSSFVTEVLAECESIIVATREQLDPVIRPTMAATLAQVLAADQHEIVIDLADLATLIPTAFGFSYKRVHCLSPEVNLSASIRHLPMFSFSLPAR